MRKYAVPALFVASATVAFGVGFVVDGISSAEQVVGQAMCVAIGCFFGSFLVTERGRARLDRPPREKGPLTTDEQWEVFFLLLGSMTGLVVSDELDPHRWTQVTIVGPLCVLAALGGLSLVLRHRRARAAEQPTE